jgi:hypothetical protein
MKFPAVILAPLLCAAADTGGGINALIDQARSAPGEFAADALIRIAALPQVAPPAQIQLLEEAFRRAGEAQQPYKRRSAVLRGGTEARAQTRAYQQDLDGLSLRLRAVEAMLPLDSRKARDLFTGMPTPGVQEVACSDYMVYDVDRYYEVLGAVASQAFNAREVERGEAYQLLALHAASIASPVEVAPMARAVASAQVKDGEFQALVSAFAGTLARMGGDDRSFTASAQAGAAIQALAEQCRRRGIPPASLIDAYRQYLINHLSARRCADNDKLAGAQVASSAGSDPVAFFNDKLRVDPVQPISSSEATAASVEGSAKGLGACNDPECQAISSQYRGLFVDASGTVYPNSVRKTTEWRDKFEELLSALDGWQQSASIPASDHFREKITMYSDVANAVGYPEREQALRAMLAYVERSGIQTENRIEWFVAVNSLIAHAAADPVPLARLAAELRASGNPVIALYARLEALAPRDPAKTVLIM